MLWSWWIAICGVGFCVGCIGAWSRNATRVFMKTLAIPLILGLSRLFWPNLYPIKNSPVYVFIDFVLLAVMALLGDYLVGLKLGRHDRQGYRSESVGH